MANYSAPLTANAVTSTFKSAGVLWAGATARRIQFYEAEFGQGGAIGTNDCQCQWDLSRIGNTVTLVGTAVTTNLLDPADIASNALFMNAVTTEPCYTTAGNGLSLKSWGINQRGSYRWRALDDGDNIMVPAVAGNGVGLRTLSNAGNFTGSGTGNISFIER